LLLESTKLQLFTTNEDSFANVVELAASEPFEARLARAVRSYPVDTDTLVRDALDELAERRRWRVAAAAAAAAVAIGLMWIVQAILPASEIATRAGEWREMEFEDGTEVMLGPNSRVRRAYDETSRLVVLESGEAFFIVAKDARPFLVDAQPLITRAVGTEFGVSRLDGSVTVTVREGRVSVAPRDRPAEALLVAGGQQVSAANEWPVPAQRIDTARELAWVSKRLKFAAGDTFLSAAQEFNRRNVLQIQIDPTLAKRPVVGELDADDPLSFAASAGREADIELITSANAVRLEVRQPPPGEPDDGARDER
jgi:transmembrane sensor